MLIHILKGKLHRAAITEAEVDYEGSIAIDEDLLDAVGFLEFEKVLVANITNGNRFTTYILKAPRGSKTVGLNGAAALLGQVGDRVTVFAWVTLTPDEARDHHPKMTLLDADNAIITLS